MANNVLVFTKRFDFKTLLEIECKVVNGFPPMVKDTVEEFESMLNLMHDVDVAIIDEPQKQEDYQILLRAIKLKEGKIRNIILLTKGIEASKLYKCFTPDQAAALIEHLKLILKPNTDAKQDYISVPIETLLHFKMVPFDLFIKLGENKYLKQILANDEINSKLLVGLQAKGVMELGFERQHNKDFSLMLLNNMINKVESDYSNEDAKFKAVNEVFVTTKDIVRGLGLPPKVIQVCESMMGQISDDVTKSKDRFSSYLTSMKTKKELNFQFRFVELTSFIATQMVSLAHKGDSEENTRTIIFSSFFCDVALKDSSLLKLRTEDSIQDLWPEDKTSVREHALKASEIIITYKKAPSEASAIIKQHHGSLDGIGFPNSISDAILPLSKCLYVAQELAIALLMYADLPSEKVILDVVNKMAKTPLHPLLLQFQKASKG